jgi:hypothetical protein
MDTVWAQERLREHSGKLKADALGQLTLLATGDLDAAERAWLRRVREEQARNDNSATGEWLIAAKKARQEGKGD